MFHTVLVQSSSRVRQNGGVPGPPTRNARNPQGCPDSRGSATPVGRVVLFELEPGPRVPVGVRVCGGATGLSDQCLFTEMDRTWVGVWAGAAPGDSFKTVDSMSVCDWVSVGRVGCGNVPDNAYAQGGQELVASAGACLACSLVGARFRPLPAPPARLSESAPFACHIPRIFRFQVLYVKAFFASCPVSLCVNTSVYSEH